MQHVHLCPQLKTFHRCGDRQSKGRGWDSSYWTSPVQIQECPWLVKPIMGHFFSSPVARGVLRFSCWQERLWFAHQWSCARATSHREPQLRAVCGAGLRFRTDALAPGHIRTTEAWNLTTKAFWMLSCPTQLHHLLENNWCASVRPVVNLPVVLKAREQPQIMKLLSGREGSVSSDMPLQF